MTDGEIQQDSPPKFSHGSQRHRPTDKSLSKRLSWIELSGTRAERRAVSSKNPLKRLVLLVSSMQNL